MNPRLCLFAIAALSFASCAHQAQHFNAPDSSKLQASSSKLAEKVTAAKATAARASAAISAAKVSTDRETAQIAGQIVPKVSELLRISPVELRPEIEALKGEVDELKVDHEETVAHVDAAKAEQRTLTAQLEEANAAKNEALKYGTEYFATVDKLTEKANAAEQGWARDSQALVKLRSESWLHRLLGILALLAIAALGFLWFTGKLTLGATKAAAAIASKIP